MNWKCPNCNAVARNVIHPIRCSCGYSTEGKESKGLGDTIAKVTSALGIKPCGRCKKRQQKLNEMFPYKDKNNGE